MDSQIGGVRMIAMIKVCSQYVVLVRLTVQNIY
jgi:hypothetical protein